MRPQNPERISVIPTHYRFDLFSCHANLDYMARAELHLHLEGSIDPETLQVLDPSISSSEIAERFRFNDFAGFLQTFKWVAQRLRTPHDYALATMCLLSRLHAAGVTHAEITLAAGVVLWKKQDLEAVYSAVRSAALESPVEVLWNLDSIRQFGPDLAMEVAEFAARHVDNGVVSIGIGGDEVAGPARWFADVYRYARANRLRLTAHAGETDGPGSIWAALEIGAERIGHGIRAIDDPLLVTYLRDRQIPLEISLTSNVMTGAVPDLASHPLRRLFDAGVPITLNTDDPGLFRTSLDREFELARVQFGFTPAELSLVAENALRYRFAVALPPRSAPRPGASLGRPPHG